MSRPVARLWRECAYCGLRTQQQFCSTACKSRHYRLLEAEAGRPRATGQLAIPSEWEAAEREYRLRLALRMYRAGLPPLAALDEAGFASDELVVAERAFYRALAQRNPNTEEVQS